MSQDLHGNTGTLATDGPILKYTIDVPVSNSRGVALEGHLGFLFDKNTSICETLDFGENFFVSLLLCRCDLFLQNQIAKEKEDGSGINFQIV